MKWHIILAMVVAICLSQIASGQNDGKKPEKKISISGIVTDTLNRPVNRALVVVDKINTKVFTNEKGHYKVKVQPDAETITIISFNDGISESAINGRKSINFTLTGYTTSQQNIQDISGGDEVNSGDELVDIGYGKIRRKDLITTVSTINGKNKRYDTYSSIHEMLRGTPGVQVIGTRVILQGQSSITDVTQPLYVVDGVPVQSINDIMPSMVENISVLKGPSAAIYGTNAIYGVILITLN